MPLWFKSLIGYLIDGNFNNFVVAIIGDVVTKYLFVLIIIKIEFIGFNEISWQESGEFIRQRNALLNLV